MTEAAAHLVDNVLPIIPYRQFVITFPIPMRYWLHTNKKLFSKIQSIIYQQITTFYRHQSQLDKRHHPQSGLIAFVQRWGSALNLNPHLHILVTDGVYYNKHDPKFKKLKTISDRNVEQLLAVIVNRILRYLKKVGLIDSNGDVVQNPMLDELFQHHLSIDMATQASLSSRIAFGPNAGKKVTKIGGGFGYEEEIPLVKGRLCCSMNGFSMHAARAINSRNRKGLEQLISYIARGPFSNNRLELLPNQRVKFELKTRFRDGTSHLLFTYGEFLEKLSALIPPPRSHLVRWSGCFAPNSPYRRKIVLKPNVRKGFQFKDDDCDNEDKPKNYSWSKLLKRVFKIDVTQCPHCPGTLAAVCSVVEQQQVRRYLKHMGIDHLPPVRGPPRSVQPELRYDTDYSDGPSPGLY